MYRINYRRQFDVGSTYRGSPVIEVSMHVESEIPISQEQRDRLYAKLDAEIIHWIREFREEQHDAYDKG